MLWEKRENFYDSLFSKGAFPLITKPTRVTGDSASIIDNIITTEIFDANFKKGIVKHDLSDHFPIFFSLNTSKLKKHEPVKVLRRDFSEKNLKNFKEQLSLLHWQHIDLRKTANDIYERFIQTFTEIYDANFPLREIYFHSKSIKSPWISNGHNKSSKTKQKLYIKLLKDKSETKCYKLSSNIRFTSFSKIFERIIYNRLYNYLTSNKLIYEKQFGFQRNNSTEHAILQLARDITNSFQKGEFTLGVFIDSSKAFDTVDHEILLRKIESFGNNERMLKLLKNYLSDRKQYVYYNDTSMDLQQIICGVPQGSILGPLLFLIYVNDLYKASSTLTEVMFADDTNLFISNRNIEKLFADMNTELTKIIFKCQKN